MAFCVAENAATLVKWSFYGGERLSGGDELEMGRRVQ